MGDFRDYVITYLAVGVVILVTLLGSHFWDKRKNGTSLQSLMDEYRYEDQPIKLLILKYVIPALTGVLVILGWPIALVLAYRMKVEAKKVRAEIDFSEFEHKPFSVSKESLIAQTFIEVIEAESVILDPLKGVPELPFGHLNSKWRAFKEASGVNAKFWKFAQVWQPEWGARQMREGYVEIRPDGSIGATFISAIKPCD